MAVVQLPRDGVAVADWQPGIALVYHRKPLPDICLVFGQIFLPSFRFPLEPPDLLGGRNWWTVLIIPQLFFGKLLEIAGLGDALVTGS